MNEYKMLDCAKFYFPIPHLSNLIKVFIVKLLSTSTFNQKLFMRLKLWFVLNM